VPSNLGIIGRYILTPAIFDAIERTPPGKGNEIQLTDALRLVREKIYAYVYRGRRYDIGSKLDLLKSNIELSLADERFNDGVEKFLRTLIKKMNINEEIINNLGDVSRNIEGKNILVTGGAGFLGSWLCEVLVEQGANVICVDNLASGL